MPGMLDLASGWGVLSFFGNCTAAKVSILMWFEMKSVRMTNKSVNITINILIIAWVFINQNLKWREGWVLIRGCTLSVCQGKNTISAGQWPPS